MSSDHMQQPAACIPIRQGDRVAGKTALVTGFGSGIGRAVALLLAAQGARVLGCDIDAEGAAATLALAEQQRRPVRGHTPCDLTDPAQVSDVVARAVDELGGIDILVNAAAFGAFEWLADMDYEAQWRKTLVGELDIVFLACKAAWPHLVERGGGSVINFGSANARMALPLSGAVAHCAGKGGVLAMSRQLAMEGAPHGIRVNTISPAMVETSATRPHLERVEGLREQVMGKLMLKRLGQPEDIAWCALYLASDEASWVTAADFAIDGGATAW
ncbi:MAG TPA: SDR family NAD(P)-dependent oxidoreductase [Ramlibacter sp.]|nr:SDR family NAD(P)-dependent oxidoreductase [Ramlibacter sp.]